MARSLASTSLAEGCGAAKLTLKKVAALCSKNARGLAGVLVPFALCFLHFIVDVVDKSQPVRGPGKKCFEAT